MHAHVCVRLRDCLRLGRFHCMPMPHVVRQMLVDVLLWETGAQGGCLSESELTLTPPILPQFRPVPPRRS